MAVAGRPQGLLASSVAGWRARSTSRRPTRVRPDLGIPFLHYTANDNGGPIPGTEHGVGLHGPARRVATPTRWSGPPLGIEVCVNGRSCLVNTSGRPRLRARSYIVNLTQALGIGDNTYARRPVPLPATMDVDYVQGLEVAPLHNGARG